MTRRCVRIAIPLLACLLTGCVERRFRVESNPPGAYVYVNNVPHGPTPVDVPFLFYGDYEIKLVKDGYETLKVKQNVSTPWYQYPIVDFFSESLWPWQITDIRPFQYDLVPVLQPNLEILKAEAEELRARGKEVAKPRYPDPREDKPTDKPSPKEPAKPTEALPTPRETPVLPVPKTNEEK